MSNKITAKLVDVLNKDGKITLTFLNEDRIYEVNWNLKKYDTVLKDFIESEEKEAQVEEWSQKYFGVPVADLKDQIGTEQEVFIYDTYASLWESQNKFTKDDMGKSFRTVIDEIIETDTEIQIWYKWNDKKYMSKMSFTQKMGDQYYLNPIKQRKQLEKFKTKFGVPIEEKEELIGHEILVKVSSAFGKFYYGQVDLL